MKLVFQNFLPDLLVKIGFNLYIKAVNYPAYINHYKVSAPTCKVLIPGLRMEIYRARKRLGLNNPKYLLERFPDETLVGGGPVEYYVFEDELLEEDFIEVDNKIFSQLWKSRPSRRPEIITITSNKFGFPIELTMVVRSEVHYDPYQTTN